jgi:SAM-dependent methyltransferase
MVSKKLYNNKFYDSTADRSVLAARVVSTLLFEIFKNPRSILDVGCGDGVWLSEIIKKWNFQEIAAIDAPTSNFRYLSGNPEVKIIRQDFESNSSLPQNSFDIVLCLEVLEHLNEKTSLEVANELSRAKLLLFSAATPGQGGTGHINERPHQYWHQFFTSKGMLKVDCVRPQIKSQIGIPKYYKNNIFVYLNVSELHTDRFDLNYLLKNSNLVDNDFRDFTTKSLHRILTLVPPRLVSFFAKVKNELF